MVGLLIAMIAIIVVIFLGLVFFMQKVFKSEVSSATSHLDSLAVEYAKKEEEIKKQFEDAKRQSQEIIANAQKDGQTQKENILKQGEEEKNKIIEDANLKASEIIKQADNARLALMADIENKINDKAIVKAADLLEIAMPEKIRSLIHANWVDDLVKSGFEQLDRLNVPEKISEIKVVSPFALSQAQKDALVAKIKEKLKIDVRIDEEIDKSVIAGMVVTIGSIFLDGSLRFRIQEAARAK